MGQQANLTYSAHALAVIIDIYSPCDDIIYQQQWQFFMKDFIGGGGGGGGGRVG